MEEHKNVLYVRKIGTKNLGIFWNTFAQETYNIFIY